MWLTVCVIVTLALMSGSRAATTCDELPPIPGYNLGGEGYDVVTMKRMTNNIIDMKAPYDAQHPCEKATNSLQGNKELRLPAAVANWNVRDKCSATITEKSHESYYKFQQDRSDAVDNSWNIGLGLSLVGMGVAGSKSSLSRFASDESKSGQSFFSEAHLECTKYVYSIKSTTPPLAKHFVDAVSRLPNKYDGPNGAYRRFIAEYGTHYFNSVTLGGRIHSLTSIHVCEASHFGYDYQSLSKCLGLEARVNLGDVSVKGEHEKCKDKILASSSSSSISRKFSKRKWNILGGDSSKLAEVFFQGDGLKTFQQWAEKLKEVPEVIDFKVTPIHQVLEYASESLIANVNDKIKSLKTAIEDYINTAAKEAEMCSNVCGFKCFDGSNPDKNCACSCSNKDHFYSNCCPKQGYGKFTISNMRGKNLSPDNPFGNKADGYLKVWGFSGIPDKYTETIYDISNPKWKANWDFSVQKAGTPFWVELREGDSGDDDSYGYCKFSVKTKKDEHCYCKAQKGNGNIYFDMKLECLENFDGDDCNRFKESPKNPPKVAGKTCSSK